MFCKAFQEYPSELYTAFSAAPFVWVNQLPALYFDFNIVEEFSAKTLSKFIKPFLLNILVSVKCAHDKVCFG